MPHYVEYDANLPDHYEYTFGFFFDLINWQFNWTEQAGEMFSRGPTSSTARLYSKPTLDIADTDINIVEFEEGWKGFSIELPLIQHWEIEADEKIKLPFMPESAKKNSPSGFFSHVNLYIEDLELDIKTSLYLDSNGYLDPYVRDVSINFGKTKYTHDNPVLAFIGHQFVPVAISVVENGIRFLGGWILTDMLGPVIDNALNHYQHKFMLHGLRG